MPMKLAKLGLLILGEFRLIEDQFKLFGGHTADIGVALEIRHRHAGASHHGRQLIPHHREDFELMVMELGSSIQHPRDLRPEPFDFLRLDVFQSVQLTLEAVGQPFVDVGSTEPESGQNDGRSEGRRFADPFEEGVPVHGDPYRPVSRPPI